MGLVASIAISLGKGLATAVGRKIGAVIVDEAFPSEPVDYFDATSQMLERIVRTAITEATVREITANVNHVKRWVKTNYKFQSPLWAPGQRVEELGRHLEMLGAGSLSRLVDPQLAMPGFSVYLVAKGLELALLQEQTLQAQAERERQAFITTRNYAAQEGYNFALNTFVNLLVARGEAVKFHDEWSLWSGNKWYWTDRVLGLRSEESRDPAAVRKEMEKHRLEVLHTLISDLGWPVAIAEDWQKLALRYDARPLYMSYTTRTEGSFYDYSNAEEYAARLGIARWNAYGSLGCMGGVATREHGANVPVYRLVANADPTRVLLQFDAASFENAQKAGWNGSGEGRGLIGFLWSDPSRVPVGTAIPVYPLVPASRGLLRTMLATSDAEYQRALSAGWAAAANGIVAYLCSEG